MVSSSKLLALAAVGIQGAAAFSPSAIAQVRRCRSVPHATRDSRCVLLCASRPGSKQRRLHECGARATPRHSQPCTGRE
jgi:hypothetical protein